ncbi:MAG: Peptide methionine sulfoxide reductase MsrB [Candidatus Levybacteria bacterium GW2011_GWA2_40_8]|nr:MAG: Peptide methionine sulfoxide reductase MsrB [Candidatus Levybacteria bacterium GW2011_GWA2_40_8]
MKKFTDESLRKKLTRESYHITQEKGTEAPFTGKYVNMKDKGMYNCIVCGAELFPSDTKFESGTGWPSFYDVANKGNVILENDPSLGMNRVEVMCANCGAHLGHVFNDGPKDKTGLRYCINSCALDFKKR